MVYIFQNHIPNNLPHYLFLIADLNCNGYVSIAELDILMQKINAGLSNEEIRRLALYASGREDGNISYEKFVKLIKELLE